MLSLHASYASGVAVTPVKSARQSVLHLPYHAPTATVQEVSCGFTGVIGYEVITRHVGPVVTSLTMARELAHGPRTYPWDLPADMQPVAWQTSRLRSVLAPCLERDPSLRPSAHEILSATACIGDATQTAPQTVPPEGITI